MGENIGSAARAMKNFGLTDLHLIAPKCEWPNDRAQMLASGAGDVIAAATLHPDATTGLAGFSLILATTARGRDVARDILTPEEAAKRLRAAAAKGQKTAILFGGERAGLDNDEISLCDALITIPTAPLPQIRETELKASSLNLGQAVLLLGYEWLKSADMTPASRTRPSLAVPATRGELIGLFEHLETELEAGGFFFPAIKREAMVRNLRAMILRSGLTDQQARTIRGMIVALVRNKYRGKM
jgi:tRNA/rRNA methyltransferase